MNIIEAIKSGKPFKRRLWGGFYVVVFGRIDYEDESLKACQPCLRVDDILATDWEVKP